MHRAVEKALHHIWKRAVGGRLPHGLSVTINFHPDIVGSGALVVERLVRERFYRSQFETGTSNGGVTAYRGGARWTWESRMLGGCYDDAPVRLRPRYGALNHRNSPVGGSPRFGSCHLRLRRHVLTRTTFCYPDNHMEPDVFGVADRMSLIELAEENALALDAVLDNYIEAHVHGPLVVPRDVDAIVLDPSYRDTAVDMAARALGCAVEWHDGFRLPVTRLKECERFRGSGAAEALAAVAVAGFVTPADIGAGRFTLLDYQAAKWAWHCVARIGREWRDTY